MKACVCLGSALAAILCSAVLASPARADDRITVTVNPATPGGDPVALGIAKGFFSGLGVDATILKGQNPTAANAAVASGDADIASYGLSAGFFNAAANSDLVVLAAVEYEKPGYAGIAFSAGLRAWDEGVRSAADLAGRKIGVGGPGGTAQYNLFMALENHKIPYGKVSVSFMQTEGNAYAALSAGTLDVAIGATGPATDMQKRGVSHLIATAGGEHPGGLINVLFTSRKTIAAKRDALVRFMKGYLKAAAYYADTIEKRDANGAIVRSPEAEEAIDIIAKYHNVSAETMVPGLAYVPPDAALDPAEVENQRRVFTALKMVDAQAETGDVVDESILRAAQGK